MREALWAELLKVRRSRLPWINAPAFTIAALVCGMFMFILADPVRARTGSACSAARPSCRAPPPTGPATSPCSPKP
ncbi:hypothetical protein [Nonomuraea sp. NPDC001699]